MRLPSQTIWDTRIQCVCGIIAAEGEAGPEIYFSANFAQATLEPPRLIVNPNRIYPIEPAIRKTGRFSVAVLPASALKTAIAVSRIDRRQPGKASVLGLAMGSAHEMPFFRDGLEIVFCEVESINDTGDHTLIVGRVLEVRSDPRFAGRKPLLYQDVLAAGPAVARLLRRLMTRTGVIDRLKRMRARRRPAPPANLAAETYEQGGQTAAEIAEYDRYGLLDRSRKLHPPVLPAIVRRQIGICVVGTNWGSFHARLVRQANPSARLFICGRDEAKTARLGRAVKADGIFTGIERAVDDDRVQALSLAMPHHLHRDAACLAMSAKKHVLVEKPIATTLEDADAMIVCAGREGVMLMVAEDMHFRPGVAAAVCRIERGEIGQPLYLLAHAGGIRRPRGWAAQRELIGGGVLMDIGVHFVRGLRLLMGEPDRVMATRAMQLNTKMSGEDSVQAIFSNRAGWQAHMLLTWASNRGNIPDIVVAGEKGTIHLWAGMPYIDVYPAAPLPLTRLISYVRPYSLQARLMHPNLQRMRVGIPGVSGYVAEYREFFAAIAEGRQPVSTARDGRRDVEIVLRGYEALASGEWTEIPDQS
jgi:UDP-N-acetylglucosamine 3-dehydrogenase